MTMRFPVRKNRDHVVSAAESPEGLRDMNGADGCRRTSPGGIDDGHNDVGRSSRPDKNVRPTVARMLGGLLM
jgi:hypothetical protein